MIEILLFPILTGLAIVTVTGPLGSFVVWRKMAYFGDTLAHSSLLGIALGIWLQIDMTLAAIIGCLVIGVLLTILQKTSQVETDSLLGILSHTSLSLGLIAISLLGNIRVDLLAVLFGDILSVTQNDVTMIVFCSLSIVLALYFLWQPLISITVDEELAKVEGLPVEKLRLALTLMVALIIALSMKIVGVLLITSLLIIPAAAARCFARSPESMAILASVFGTAALFAGLAMSYFYDTPAGPSIVVCCSLIFIVSLIVRQK